MAQIDLKDTQSGTAGINLFGFQVPTWLLVVAVIFVTVIVFYMMRKPAAPAPMAAITAPVAPVMQAAGRALKKLLRG
jgi:hypothetical protein